MVEGGVILAGDGGLPSDGLSTIVPNVEDVVKPTGELRRVNKYLLIRHAPRDRWVVPLTRDLFIDNFCVMFLRVWDKFEVFAAGRASSRDLEVGVPGRIPRQSKESIIELVCCSMGLQCNGCSFRFSE